jgi:hypothetical protein
MPLIDLKTNLKSLKFGFDLPAGGSSKQPFVEKPIPSDDEPTPGASPDYLLRQGTLRRIADDETRFFKYFTSTPGLAFIAKQNALSLTSVRTQASRGPSNQGTYLPTNTSAQLAANPFGGHLNFLGVDPTGLLGGIRKYGEVITPTQTNDDNRLVTLQNNLIQNRSTGNFNFVKGTTINPLPGVLYNYRGGPGAVEGRGKTNIYRYSFTGLDNPLYTNNPNYFLGKNNNKIHTPDDPSTWVNIPLGATVRYNGTRLADLGQSGIVTPSSFLGSTFTLGNINTSVYKTDYSSGTGSLLDKREDLNTYLVGKQHDDGPGTSAPLGVANGWFNTTKLIDSVSFPELTTDGGITFNPHNSISIYKSGSLETDTDVVRRNNPSVEVWNQEFFQDSDINTDSAKRTGKIKEDFRSVLRRKLRYNLPGQLAYSGAGSGKILDERVNQGNPGSPLSPLKDVSSYANGSGTGPIDRINALPIYKSTDAAQEIRDNKAVNDLIKFRIASVNNDKPSEFEYIHFRAFIDSFSDSYGTQWAGERYPGRGEEFFRYGGFTRGISLSFTVAAQSKEELMPMYKKLNFLASNTMNDYSDSGYMRAPFIKLTIGGYLYEQFGFLKGIQYGWEMAAPFEIGINDFGNDDPNVKELPHVIRVTGFDFQPIYDFLPQKQRNGFSDSGELTTYGPEKYIALANGIGKGSNNYDTDADGLTNSNPNTVGVGSSQLD